MEKQLLKNSNSAQKRIHELAKELGATEIRPVSKEEKDRIEKAADIALERIRHNNTMQNSEIENMKHVLYLKR